MKIFEFYSGYGDILANVEWDWDSTVAEEFAPEEDPEDWGFNEDEGFDPYEGCYTWDC